MDMSPREWGCCCTGGLVLSSRTWECKGVNTDLVPEVVDKKDGTNFLVEEYKELVRAQEQEAHKLRQENLRIREEAARVSVNLHELMFRGSFSELWVAGDSSGTSAAARRGTSVTGGDSPAGDSPSHRALRNGRNAAPTARVPDETGAQERSLLAQLTPAFLLQQALTNIDLLRTENKRLRGMEGKYEGLLEFLKLFAAKHPEAVKGVAMFD